MKNKVIPINCSNCALKEICFFCDLKNSKDVVTYKKGQTIYVQRAPQHGLFNVLSGNIKISKIGTPA